MAQKIASLYAEIGANTKPLEDGLNRSKQKLGDTGKEATKLGDKIGSFAKGFGKFALEAGVTSLGAAFIYATKQAAELESTFAQISALTNTPTTAIAGLRKEVLALSSDLPISSNELAKGLYYISSSGFQGAEAMSILNMSAKAAAAGLGETKTIADAVTSALNAYQLQGKDAARITDLLTFAVREGKGEPAELAGSLGRVLPVAAAAKVGMEDVAAAMAIMTRTGLTADEAATSLRGTIGALLAPAKQSVEALGAIGLTTADVASMLSQPGGLVNVLKTLMERTGGNIEQLDAIIPNIRALTGVLSLAGSQADDYATALKSAYNALGLTDRAAAEMANTMEYKLAKAKNSVENLGIAITEKLLPGLGQAADAATILITWQDKMDAALDNVNKELQDSEASYEDYRKGLVEAAVAAGKLTRSQGDLIIQGKRVTDAGIGQVDITDRLTTSIGLLTKAQVEQARSDQTLANMADFASTVHAASAAAIKDNTQATQWNAIETDKMAKEKDKAAKAEQKLAEAIGEAKVQFEEYTASFKEFTGASLLQLQIDQLKESIKASGDPTGVLTAKLHELEMQTGAITPSAEAARDAYSVLSEMFTKNYLSGSELESVLGKLKQAAADGKVDVKELGLSASEAATYFYILNGKVADTNTEISNIPRHIVIDVEYHRRVSGEVDLNAGDIGPQPNTVPQTHTTTTTGSGGSGGHGGGHEVERTIAGPRMSITAGNEAAGGKGSGLTIINNITAAPEMNINELSARVSQKIARNLRSAVSSGAGYAGG